MKKENTKTQSCKTRKKGVVIAASVCAGICLAAGIVIVAAPDKTSNLLNSIMSKINTHTHLSGVSKKDYLLSAQKDTISKAVENSVLKPEPIIEVVPKRMYSPYSAPFSVKGGPVRLGHGRKPSPEKIAFGKTIGMDFEKLGITWQNNYMKGVA